MDNADSVVFLWEKKCGGTPFGVVGWSKDLEDHDAANIHAKLGVVGLQDAVRVGVCWLGALFRMM